MSTTKRRVAVPPMPLALVQRGACARHPHPEWWSSRYLAEQEAAAWVCRTSCPVLGLCSAWRDQVPAGQRQGVTFAGERLPVHSAGYFRHQQAG